MITTFGSTHLARFRAAVASSLGLQFDESRLGELSEVFARLGEASLGGPEAYLARLEGRPTADDIRALARRLTVGETYFFRNPQQFSAFADVALAGSLGGASTPRMLRILSAGCASGEEAYSLAIIACERLGHPGDLVSITAFDVNPAGLERAAAGRYSAWSLRETPAEVRRRWFVPVARDYLVHPSVRIDGSVRRTKPRQRSPQRRAPEIYDVIFFRNVLMYLTTETARAVVVRMRRALAPGGYLFLGPRRVVARPVAGVPAVPHAQHLLLPMPGPWSVVEGEREPELRPCFRIGRALEEDPISAGSRPFAVPRTGFAS